MSRRVLLVCFISILCNSAYGYEPTKTDAYLKIGVGGSIYKKFPNTGGGGYAKERPKSHPIYTIGVGHSIIKHISAALNFSYGSWQYKASNSRFGVSMSQQGRQLSAIVNGYYNILIHKSVIPYITAGAGASSLQPKDLIELIIPTQSRRLKAKRTTKLSYNAGAGIKYNLGKRKAIDVSYLYTYYGKISTQNLSTLVYVRKVVIASHNIGISFYYHF